MGTFRFIFSPNQNRHKNYNNIQITSHMTVINVTDPPTDRSAERHNDRATDRPNKQAQKKQINKPVNNPIS
jgi:hypothetical protein